LYLAVDPVGAVESKNKVAGLAFAPVPCK
jgi:hypothetical protein